MADELQSFWLDCTGPHHTQTTSNDSQASKSAITLSAPQVAADMASTMALDTATFTCFGKLPLEIKLEIWKQYNIASTTPRDIRVTLHPTKGFNSLMDDTYKSPTPTPAILHICHDSRAEGLKTYKTIFNSSRSIFESANKEIQITRHGIYVNPVLDTIAIRFSQTRPDMFFLLECPTFTPIPPTSPFSHQTHTLWIFSSFKYERDSPEQLHFLIQPCPAPKEGDLSGWAEPWYRLRGILGAGRGGFSRFGGLSTFHCPRVETLYEQWRHCVKEMTVAARIWGGGKDLCW